MKFLISNLNLFWCNWRPFSLILPLGAQAKSLIPTSLQAKAKCSTEKQRTFFFFLIKASLIILKVVVVGMTTDHCGLLTDLLWPGIKMQPNLPRSEGWETRYSFDSREKPPLFPLQFQVNFSHSGKLLNWQLPINTSIALASQRFLKEWARS